MKRARLPRGVRKYIREEKARIKTSAVDQAERERLIVELLARFREYRHEEQRGA